MPSTAPASIQSPSSGVGPLLIVSSSRNSRKKTRKKQQQRCDWMHLLMVVGITFCVADTLYFVSYLHTYNDLTSAFDNRQAGGGSSSSDHYSVMNAIRQGIFSAEHLMEAKLDQVKKDYTAPLRGGGVDTAAKRYRPSERVGNEPIFELLRDAGIDPDTLGNETLNQLPSWDEVTSLYGSEPILYGLDTCQAFRERSDPAEHFIGVAGSFNTGTNLLADLLIKNCFMPERVQKYGAESRGMRWQMPYGKHTPIDNETYRLTHKTDTDHNMDANNFFAATCIRDPAVWAPSMCRHAYAMDWSRGDSHCPNLIANEQDVAVDSSLTIGDKIPVTIEYAEFSKTHTTMLDHYSDYYGDYMKAKFPRLIVRFEDLIFFPKQGVTQICHCAGGDMVPGPFQYVIESAKKGSAHGKKSQRTGFVDAIIRYGTRQARWRGMTTLDLDYVKQAMDPELLRTFHYLGPD